MPVDVKTSLPDSLRDRFAALEQRLWRQETTVAVCGAIGSLAVSAGLLFCSDRLWDTPPLGRTIITGLGITGATWFALRWTRNWVLRRRDVRALARLVQKQHRKLGDRLLGIVELADDSKRSGDISPALCRAAIQQVSVEALTYDFSIAAPARTANRWRSIIVALAAASVIAAIVIPPALRNVLARWAVPFASIPRYTFVSIGNMPDELIVPHGEIFEVNCPFNAESIWKPSVATAQFGKQRPVTSKVVGSSATFKVPGQTQRGTLLIKVGDATRTITIVPTYRPALREMTAKIELPGYLRYPNVDEKIQNGSFTFVEGSRVTFSGKISRALSNASLSLGPKNEQTLEVSAETFSATPLLADGISRLDFSWRDTLGLGSAGTWSLAVQSRKDTPPRVDFVNLPPDLVMLPSDVLDAQVLAEDDFGVREIGFIWERDSEGSATNKLYRKESRVASTTPQEKRKQHGFQFSPAVAQIPPDSSVELRAVAIDYFPGRERVSSGVRRVHVISNEQHAELIRQQLESALARLEEVTRGEDSLAASTKALKDLPKDKLAGEEAAKKAGEQADKQAQLARQIEQISKETAEAVREAMRNPTFKEETLREWAKNAQEMQKLSKGSMQQAQKSLKSAQQSAESRPKELAEAQKAEQQAVESLEDIQKRMNRDVDNLQARTLAERLRMLAGKEMKLDSTLQRLVPETIGLHADELPERLRSSTLNVARDQADHQAEALGLQGEISRFYDRTQRATYGAVSKEMTDAKTGDELDRIRGLIQENIAMEAMDNLTVWAKRLGEWADKLEPKSEEGGESGAKGSSSGNQQEDMTRQLMALLRLRDQETALQKRTRLLEEQKVQDPGYVKSAGVLQQNQQKIKSQLADIEMANKVAQLSPTYLETGLALGEVEGLLSRPETGTPTDQSQTKAVDLFSDLINLINEQAKKNSQARGSPEEAAQEMEFMMQMASQEGQPGQGKGQQPGQTPGGNNSGGGTGRPDGTTVGNASGKSGGPRKVAQATGEGRSVPSEFREALESYFKAVDQEPASVGKDN